MEQIINPFSLDCRGVPGRLEFPCGILRLENGNTLVADAGSETGKGSEILEISPGGQVIRCLEAGLRFAHSIKQLSDGRFLVADTTNNRLVELEPGGKVLFTSMQWGGGSGRLSDGSRLAYPNNIHLISDDLWLVTDRNNNRFVVVDRGGQVHRTSPAGYKHPHNCELTGNGNVLFADSDNNAVVEIDSKGREVWRYDADLCWPRDANRLDNGNTLIADSKNNRVIEVSGSGETVWEFKVGYFANFYEAHRLPNGNTLMSDQQHKRIIEVNLQGEIVWEFRNFERETPVNEKLDNGFFKRIEENGFPVSWHLDTRFSEGGGRLLWRKDENDKRICGLEFDREGALCLRQTVAVQAGLRYNLGGALSTEGLDGFACLQLAFLDHFGGLLQDAALCPGGTSFSGDTPWTQDSFEILVPEDAEAADIRIFLTGKGRVFFKQIRFYY